MRRSLGRKMFVLVSALLLSAVFKAEAADQQFGYMKFARAKRECAKTRH